MTQETGTVEAVEGSLDVSLYPIGSFLKMIPYHVSIASPLFICSAVAVMANPLTDSLLLPSLPFKVCRNHPATVKQPQART